MAHVSTTINNFGNPSFECPICLNYYTDHIPASEDYFVSTTCNHSNAGSGNPKIGHVFHYQCLLKSIAFRLDNDEPEEVDEGYEFRREIAEQSFKCPICRNDNQRPNLTRLFNITLQERPIDETPDHELKIAILGTFRAGKTSIVKRFANNVFDHRYISTVAVDTFSKTIQMGDKRWDTAGQEEHRSIVTSYVRNAFGLIFVFDLTKHSSFVELNDWIKFANDHGPQNTKRILVGNKLDLSNRKVSLQEAMELAERFNYPYLECSAKEAFNISEIFRLLTAEILGDKLTIMNADKVAEKTLLHKKLCEMKLSEKVKLLCCE